MPTRRQADRRPCGRRQRERSLPHSEHRPEKRVAFSVESDGAVKAAPSILARYRHAPESGNVSVESEGAR
jgi:hypothetical protein